MVAFLPVVLVTLEVLQCRTSLSSESSDWDRSGGGEKQTQNEHGGWERGWGEIATHNSPPERPCCCYRRRRSRRRKVGRTAAVSLVTEGGEIMK